jgi:hypothetical protein
LTVANALAWQPLNLPSLAVLLAALGVGNLACFFVAQRLGKGAGGG